MESNQHSPASVNATASPIRHLFSGVVPCLLGALLVWLSGAVGRVITAGETGPAEVWAADRDGHAVVGLGQGLYEKLRCPVPWPVRVLARADRGAWVLSSKEGYADGAHGLERIDAVGRRLQEVAIGPVADLVLLNGEDVLAIEQRCEEPERILRIGSCTRTLGEIAGAVCIASQGDTALVGTLGGEVLLLDAVGGAGVQLSAVIGGECADVAPGPDAGSWWVLDVSPPSRLMLLDAALTQRWEVPVGLSALFLVPVPGEERVWIADVAMPRVRRFGPLGALELAVDDLPLIGLGRGCAWREGGVLFVAGGALIHLDVAGRMAPGQGGFDYLAEVDRVPITPAGNSLLPCRKR